MLTKEQAESIKKQILSQIERFPEQQREAARQQIEAMNEKELEEFLIKNKLIGQGQKLEQGQKQAGKSSECIFCSIAQGKISSYKIDENKEAVAVLEINPETKGHAIIIPKQHLTAEKIPGSVLSLAKKIAKKQKAKLKPLDVELSTESAFGHSVVNVVPIYDDNPREKKKASESDLKEMQLKLAVVKKEKREKKPKEQRIDADLSRLPKAPRRIP